MLLKQAVELEIAKAKSLGKFQANICLIGLADLKETSRLIQAMSRSGYAMKRNGEILYMTWVNKP